MREFQVSGEIDCWKKIDYYMIFCNRICYNDTATWDVNIVYYLTETEDWREGWKQRAVFIVVAL